MQLVLKHNVGYFGLKNCPAREHNGCYHRDPEYILHRNLPSDPGHPRLPNRIHQARAQTDYQVPRRVYSPEAAGGAGCKLKSREIVATIIPERNCMVATSLLSNAWGVDDSTSKTPSVRRKWRRGETRSERTPIRRQLAQSTRGFDSSSLQSSTSPVRTHSAERPLSVCRRTPISGAVRPVRARQTISLPRRSAMAAPVAPVSVCAFSAMMLMPRSRSISPALMRACGTEADP